jgi:hypothetical protein
VIRNQANRAAVPQRPLAPAPDVVAPEPALRLIILVADAYHSARWADTPHPLLPSSPYPELDGSDALRTLGRTIRRFEAGA